MTRHLRLGLLLVTASLALPPRAEVRAQGGCTPATVMSAGPSGTDGTSLSSDGRYMAFQSGVPLLPDDTNSQGDIYVFDREACGLERVSVSSDEVQGNLTSMYASISLDGRFVAFLSQADNLGSTPDDNGTWDVFVRDRLSGITTLVSVAVDGGWTNGPANIAIRPTISGNGEFVAFWSSATNLVVGDTNGGPDVFVRDLLGSVTTRVSVATGGTQVSGGEGVFPDSPPAISADGRYVVFTSARSGLVPGDTGAVDVFRHDRQAVQTIRVSVAWNGSALTSDSFTPGISRDGNQISFVTTGAGVVPDDTNGVNDVFVRDVLAATTTRVSQVSHGGEINAGVTQAALSGDGRHVAFSTTASNIVPGDTLGFDDVFVQDRLTGITRRVSLSAGGVQANGPANDLAISDDGWFVSFESPATNLGPPNAGALYMAFVTDWRSVSAPPNTNLLRNFDFAGGLQRWGTFAQPSPGNLVWNITSGVLQFYRETGSTQAVVLQSTGGQLPAFAPVRAAFQLANSSASRKRITVLVHDGNFADLSVCSFWLDANAPIRQYEMRTHTTRMWADATISFYAATADSTGFYRLDNVSLEYAPALPDAGTICVDPTTPVPVSLPPESNLLVNGDFSAGLPPWGLFGQIVSQITDGVFEFYRPSGTPAGVVLQSTGTAFVDNRILTLNLRLGNSSSVRKRVTVLVHDLDFSDLSACTFWLPPGLPLSDYAVFMFTTKAWTNATVSVYPASIGADQWFQLDNLVLRHTQGAGPQGTTCFEPDLSAFTSPGSPGPPS